MNKVKKGMTIVLLGVLAAVSLTGCTVKAYQNKLSCCGTITRYSDKTLAVSGCSYFSCTRDTGRWNKISGGYSFYTTDGKYNAVGQLNGDVMTIVVP